jgi:hypothetical protein
MILVLCNAISRVHDDGTLLVEHPVRSYPAITISAVITDLIVLTIFRNDSIILDLVALELPLSASTSLTPWKIHILLFEASFYLP